MKKIILVAAMFLLFSGVVSAASINGDYKGNPIVKLKSKGVLVDSGEVPAMIYDGKTLVPISALRNLGAEVTWDAKSYSVDVNFPNNQLNNQNKNDDIKTIKLYMKIANHYKRLALQGEMLHAIGESYSTLFDAIQLNLPAKSFLDKSFNMLNDRINSYNDFIQKNEDMINEANLSGIDISNMRNILGNYNKSIDYYKLSYEGISSYYSNINDSNFSKYLDNKASADSLVNGSLLMSDNGYFDYYDKSQNY